MLDQLFAYLLVCFAEFKVSAWILFEMQLCKHMTVKRSMPFSVYVVIYSVFFINFSFAELKFLTWLLPETLSCKHMFKKISICFFVNVVLDSFFFISFYCI